MQSFGFNSLPFCNLQDGFCVWFCLSHSNFRFFLFSNRKNTKLWTNKIRESKFMIQIWWLMACVFAFLVNKTVWNLVNSQIEICKLESWVTFALAGFTKNNEGNAFFFAAAAGYGQNPSLFWDVGAISTCHSEHISLSQKMKLENALQLLCQSLV